MNQAADKSTESGPPSRYTAHHGDQGNKSYKEQWPDLSSSRKRKPEQQTGENRQEKGATAKENHDA